MTVQSPAQIWGGNDATWTKCGSSSLIISDGSFKKKIILKKSCSFTTAGMRLSQVANAVFYSLPPEAAPFWLERGKNTKLAATANTALGPP